ncbi:HDOD domain-containing protein [Pelagicoccus sp. SDUM812002]|uniref:HDOD domain-containing protein n=1 Tax=Pelagicoccus sp. SDUM812002 TaxID=3041266 RepID=UPI00281031EC|nr:HDOD domain-containing protein [Pelagicoccus sp. SDUM812002]MDQ8185663.1 HDOD domain-containing protein [Pelagicoccus sp. SDUM812002]
MAAPIPDTLNPLARKTLRRLNEALEGGKTGAMPEIVQTVRKLSGQIATVSIQDLSEIIERDPSVTEKVISAANTFGYNPNGIEIGTITEAIHTVGFDRIRNLTLTVMLAQNAGKGMDSDTQREMASLSVCSGLLAQNLVSSSERFSADPDIAFVSGSLRNYGKLLMSTFFVDEYTEARDLARQGGDDSAYCDIFGMTPLDLGHTLLLSTNLPDIIMESLQSVSKEKLARSAQTDSEEILIAAEFCVKVCELSFDETLNPEAFKKELNALVQMFGDSIPIDVDMVLAGLEEVDSSMSQLNEVIGIKNSPANRALRARIDGRSVRTVAQSSKKGVEIGIGKPNTEPERDLNEILEGMLESEEPLDDEQVKTLYGSLNLAIAAELELDCCMTFLEDQENSRSVRFSARHGNGLLYDRIKNRPLVSSDNKDIFSICLGRREDILIQDAKAGKISKVIPEWIHERGDVNSLIILPASLSNKLFAIFVGVKLDGSAIEIAPATHQRLKQLRTQLAKMQARR